MSKFRYSFVGWLCGAAVLSAVVITSCNDQANAEKQPKLNIEFQDKPPKEGVAALIGSKDYTTDELAGDAKSQLVDIEKKKVEFLRDRAAQTAIEKTLREDAQKANIPYEEFVDKKVVAGKDKVSKSEYKNFVEKRKIPLSQINEQIEEKIYGYLKSQKREALITSYVAKSMDRKNEKIVVYAAKPEMKMELDVGTAPTYGKKDAKIVVVEFSDFQCPYCSRGADTMAEVKKKYGKEVLFAFMHFPLPMHKDAKPAAVASMCVNEQGNDKFWKFHDIAFKNQQKLDTGSLEGYAKQSGANVKKYQECMDSKKYEDIVQKNMQYGEKMGVQSTPTTIVYDRQRKVGSILTGALPTESIIEEIEGMKKG